MDSDLQERQEGKRSVKLIGPDSHDSAFFARLACPDIFRATQVRHTLGKIAGDAGARIYLEWTICDSIGGVSDERMA